LSDSAKAFTKYKQKYTLASLFWTTWYIPLFVEFGVILSNVLLPHMES